jgi:hypothetical protein
MPKNNNKKMIHFSGRTDSKLGMISTGIGVLDLIGFITAGAVSGMYHGKAGMIIGIAGLFLFALAVLGFVMSCKALREKDVFFRFPIAGITLNGFMMVVFMILYILGLC